MVPWTGGPACLLLTVAAALTQLMRTPGCCGSQIIGGHEVIPHSRPYMVSVSFEGQHHCGGFLVHARWVVSAAHCFSDRDPFTGLVVLGAHALLTPEPTKQVFSIAAIVRHPGYQPATQANDICLLRLGGGRPCRGLRQPPHKAPQFTGCRLVKVAHRGSQLNGSAVLGPAVKPLRLPRRGARPPLAGTRCLVSGWGFLSDFEEPPPGLMEVEVRVLDLNVCNGSWQGLLSPTMLCTHSRDRRWRGFCSADSGGPLVCGNRAQGLASFSGLWCADPKTPDVYTRVSAFVAWIWGVVRSSSPGSTGRSVRAV